MRLLALTNLYPPLGYGYGAICADVMEELATRGHECRVLCAAGGPGAGAGVTVREGLGHVPGGWRRPVAGLRADLASQRLVSEELARGVDAVLVWHMRGIGKGSLALAHDAGVPVVYMLGDLWAVYEHPGPPAAWRAWQALGHMRAYRAVRDVAGRLAGLGRVDLRPAPIERDGVVCFASGWLRDRYAQAGFEAVDGHVVHNGVRLEDFAGRRDAVAPPPLRALFAGRVDATKGADIAIAAVGRVPGVSLAIAGGGDLAWARGAIERAGVATRVRLCGEMSRAEVAALMRASDVFLMPARIADAFGLVYVEAMAAGAVVAGTAKGGAAEICDDEVNALVVGEEPAGLAQSLVRLRDDPALRARLAGAGAETARRFSLERMVDRVEALLRDRLTSRP